MADSAFVFYLFSNGINYFFSIHTVRTPDLIIDCSN
ncbi:hypothetical protein KPNJ1_04961 [Klebsiella pneumoniae 30660/NJST258_1]|uniref:Uncharacterized protein n=1 Tax=Klebsiella pneumoniae 30684/NJST258_2 TaxID=1420013 RepID=W8V656_KLEPN|nr:hypothetical protein KPNJ2_04910 [Klebsiella pneumoniae 30684/NJST258_2]AHM87361.1 hypothetical protein KPNJ1_04961 [Klebsiella pneumoniae 30660/NJST258_1]